MLYAGLPDLRRILMGRWTNKAMGAGRWLGSGMGSKLLSGWGGTGETLCRRGTGEARMLYRRLEDRVLHNGWGDGRRYMRTGLAGDAAQRCMRDHLADRR
jgi:hypothetical protein